TVTASICLSISSSILRKSLYFFAFGNFSAIRSTMLSSTSQMATTFPTCPACSVSPWPLPPTPTQAKLICSLAALLAATLRPPAAQKPIPARVDCFRKSRRLLRELMNELLVRKAPQDSPGGGAAARSVPGLGRTLELYPFP